LAPIDLSPARQDKPVIGSLQPAVIRAVDRDAIDKYRAKIVLRLRRDIGHPSAEESASTSNPQIQLKAGFGLDSTVVCALALPQSQSKWQPQAISESLDGKFHWFSDSDSSGRNGAILSELPRPIEWMLTSTVFFQNHHVKGRQEW
jgi:hypothetical protein